MKIRIKIMVFIFSFILFVAPAAVYGANVTLTWDHNEPLPDGYKLFQRSDGQAYDYTKPVWQGSENTARVQDLEPGHTYFFVCRAYVAENESGDSNEVKFTGDIPAPVNLKVQFEISVYIDINGNPIITAAGGQQ